ncbi:MAG: hypothetical protein JJT85_10115 [Chromatiales bacterium]|nr:hypothetical protein [Chromatiales bacterium]
MRKLGAYLGALATGTLALSMQAQGQVVELSIDEGSATSPRAASCTGFDLLFAGEDCTYNNTGSFGGPWIGPQTRDGFFPLGEARIFADGPIPAGAVAIPLSGTIEIDRTGACSEHTIAATIQMGPFTRNFQGNARRQVDDFPNGITQTIATTPFASGEANLEGGCDYTLGANGVPDLLTGPDGDFPGNVQASAWTGPAGQEISRFGGSTTPNPGAQAVATVGAGYECLVSTGACGAGDVAFAWNTAERASWNNIVGNISTNANGDIVDAFLYVVHDEIEIATFAGQRITFWAYTVELTASGEGPPGPVEIEQEALAVQDGEAVIPVRTDTGVPDPVEVSIQTSPENGTVLVSGSPGNAADISITYTPNAGFSGTDSFQYLVETTGALPAGGISGASSPESALVTVTIEVIQPGANDVTVSTRRNAPILIDVLANDVGFTDPVFLDVVVPPGLGTVQIVDADGIPVTDEEGNQANLRILYTPDLAATAGQTGQQDVFTYTVSATGGDPDVFVFTQLVQNVPFGIVDSDVSPSLNVLGGSATVDNGSVSVSGLAWESLNPNASADYLSDWSTAVGEGVTVTKIDESCEQVPGTNASGCGGPYGVLGDWIPGELQDGTASAIATVDVALDGNTLTVTRITEVLDCSEPGQPPVVCLAFDARGNGFPNNNYSITTYTFVAGSAGASDTAEVTVNILNQVPVADSASLTISTQGTAPADASGQINVATIAGNSLGDAPATVTVSNAMNGTATIDGTTVTFVPSIFSGHASFDYTITDEDGETATANVGVTVPNLTPVLGNGSGEAQVGGSVEVDLLPLVTPGNGSPAQHELLVTTQASQGSCSLSGFTLTYAHAGTEAGTDACVVTLIDGNGDSDTGTINITITAPPPVAEGPGRFLPGGSSSFDLWSLALLAGLPLLGRRRRMS